MAERISPIQGVSPAERVQQAGRINPAAGQFGALLRREIKEAEPAISFSKHAQSRAAERGIVPYSATPATLRLQITPPTLELDANTRFSIGACNYGVTDNLGNGAYELTCETAGEIGNAWSGPVLPIDYVEGLESCTITGLLVPGEDEEDTEAFRKRYFDSLNAQAFGGNRADYLEKVNAIPGVGEARRTALLKHFRSVKAIKEASLQELEQAVPKSTAKAVFEWFHQEET